MIKPKPCPFCGAIPEIFPEMPVSEGNTWGQVRCVNLACSVRPSAEDGISIADDRGSNAYKEAAIIRWNIRAGEDDK